MKPLTQEKFYKIAGITPKNLTESIRLIQTTPWLSNLRLQELEQVEVELEQLAIGKGSKVGDYTRGVLYHLYKDIAAEVELRKAHQNRGKYQDPEENNL